MTIIRNGSQASIQGPVEYFTGNARIDPLATAQAPATVSCANVTFEPGARSEPGLKSLATKKADTTINEFTVGPSNQPW